ncbi:hypothetical protein ABPG74_006917 [Tetrahymena malaccensis]
MSTPIATTLSELMLRKIKYQNSFESQRRFNQNQKNNFSQKNSSSFLLSKQNSNQNFKLAHQRSQSHQNITKPQIVLRNEEGQVYKQNLQQQDKFGLNVSMGQQNKSAFNQQRSHQRNLTQGSNHSANQDTLIENVIQKELAQKVASHANQNSSSTASTINQINSSKNIHQNNYLGILPQSNNHSFAKSTSKSHQSSNRDSKQLNQDFQQDLQGIQIRNNQNESQSDQNQKIYSDLKNITNLNSLHQNDQSLSLYNRKSRKQFRQMSNITNITNKSTENIFEDSISPLKNQKNNYKMKYINISQSYLQQGFQSAKLNHNKFNDSSAFQNSTNASSIPLSNKQNQRSQASLTSTNFLQQNKQESENHRISQIKEKLNQINIPQFLIPQLHGIQSSNSQLPKSSASLRSNIKSNFNSISIPQGTNQMSQLQQQIEGLNLQQKEQQLEMLLLTNKKLNNIERLQLKKQIQEIQVQKAQQFEDFIFDKIKKDLQTYSVTHHYTCENLIETLLGTIKDLSNFKNPKIVIKSIERNFGHLQQPLDFLQFDQVTNVKEIETQIYLKRLALACCKVEGEEIQFKPNKKLLDGLLEITTKLEEKLLIYQKDHFSEITNQLLSKNSQIRKTEQELQEKYIQLDRKAQYKELRETIDSKYNLNMRHMESKFLNSYKKNKDKLGNFSNLCKRSINIFKNIDGVVFKLKEVINQINAN